MIILGQIFPLIKIVLHAHSLISTQNTKDLYKSSLLSVSHRKKKKKKHAGAGGIQGSVQAKGQKQTKGSFSSKNICAAGILTVLWFESLGVAQLGQGTMTVWHPPDTQIWPEILRADLSRVPCCAYTDTWTLFCHQMPVLGNLPPWR